MVEGRGPARDRGPRHRAVPGEDPALFGLSGEVGRRGLPFQDLVRRAPGASGLRRGSSFSLVCPNFPGAPGCPV
ncbi:hypothetical protein GCM10022207_17040 [Streptomyces lannensis]|uniref:Uncharacterized protein n=1 Tax=Streptomyces lannensis TaxID=766498 RepID=A0ABP7JTK8_9ACTN